jgi:adsorption protein B
MDGVFGWLELALREATLFAACGFLLLGLSDLAVDGVWIVRTLWRRVTVYRRFARAQADTLGELEAPGALAVFVPAWEEAAVIGEMLRHALETFDHPDYRIFVGCYPNDPEGIAAVQSLRDPRILLAIGAAPGPTTKADCLNSLWRRMLAEEGTLGRRFKAVVLHDAEDVVHSAELRIFDLLIEIRPCPVAGSSSPR